MKGCNMAKIIQLDDYRPKPDLDFIDGVFGNDRFDLTESARDWLEQCRRFDRLCKRLDDVAKKIQKRLEDAMPPDVA